MPGRTQYIAVRGAAAVFGDGTASATMTHLLRSHHYHSMWVGPLRRRRFIGVIDEPTPPSGRGHLFLSEDPDPRPGVPQLPQQMRHAEPATLTAKHLNVASSVCMRVARV